MAASSHKRCDETELNARTPPEHPTFPVHVPEVPQTPYSHIHSLSSTIRFVHTQPCRRTEYLHAVVAGGQQDSAQYVDENVVGCTQLGRIAAWSLGDDAYAIFITSMAGPGVDESNVRAQHCC